MKQDQDSERPRFATIHYGVMRQLAISPLEYVLLDMVYHLSAKYGYCYKTAPSMAVDLGISERGARKLIARLIERELLTRSAAGLICSNAYIDVAYLNKVPTPEQSTATSRNKVPSPGTKFRKTGTKFPNNRGLDIQENNNKDIQTLAKAKVAEPASKRRVDIDNLFDNWQQVVGYPISSKLKANRYACSNLVKKHTEAGVLRLIQGVAQTKSDQYAPRIADFCELQSKLTNLLAWGQKKEANHAVAEF